MMPTVIMETVSGLWCNITCCHGNTDSFWCVLSDAVRCDMFLVWCVLMRSHSAVSCAIGTIVWLDSASFQGWRSLSQTSCFCFDFILKVLTRSGDLYLLSFQDVHLQFFICCVSLCFWRKVHVHCHVPDTSWLCWLWNKRIFGLSVQEKSWF